MTTVYFRCEEESETCYKPSDEDLLTFIEEWLYILWDLTPSDRNWKQLFNRFNFAHFDYCDTEYFTMEYKPLKTDGSEIMVTMREGL